MDPIIDLLNSLDLPLVWRNFLVSGALLLTYLISRLIKRLLNR